MNLDVNMFRYYFRIMLRSREKSRESFIEMRKHVMIKIEILDEKHVRELGLHLRSLMEALHGYHHSCSKILDDFKANSNLNAITTPLETTFRRESFLSQDIEDDEQAAPLICTDDW